MTEADKGREMKAQKWEEDMGMVEGQDKSRQTARPNKVKQHNLPLEVLIVQPEMKAEQR